MHDGSSTACMHFDLKAHLIKVNILRRMLHD